LSWVDKTTLFFFLFFFFEVDDVFFFFRVHCEKVHLEKIRRLRVLPPVSSDRVPFQTLLDHHGPRRLLCTHLLPRERRSEDAVYTC